MTGQAVKPEDHRTRVAQQRRDRMRERLLSAAMNVYARHDQHTTPVIDDVIREAGVARGTFYKYFTSMEELFDALGNVLSDEMQRGMEELLLGKLTDPLLRVATGSQLFLLRSVIDPVWAGFVSRTDNLAKDSYFLQIVSADVAALQAAGVVAERDADAVVDLLLGAMLASIRRLAQISQPRRKYVEDSAALLLCGIGIPSERATEIVRERAIYIRGSAPDYLSWWRDPWAAH